MPRFVISPARALVRPSLRQCLIALAFLAVPALVRAQDASRPRLADEADPNSWEAYYDYGIAKLQVDRFDAADTAFAWASRIDPTRAEPHYAQWVTYWMRDLHKFTLFLKDDESLARDTTVRNAEARRELALRRNPFVHQGLETIIFDRLPGRWGEDLTSRAWIAYGQGHLEKSLDEFGEAVRRHPERIWLHTLRASAFANLGNADSAASELDVTLKQLRARDEAKVGDLYQSKELLEYGIGLAELQRRHADAARVAFGRAAVENPAFGPAHVQLGELALASRDTATAISEMALAADLEPSDPLVMMAYARALVAAGRPADALPRTQAAVAAAPYYADARLLLGAVLERTGDRAGAAKAYNAFLGMATRNDGRRSWAMTRLTALGDVK